MERLTAKGQAPGWISRHRATLIAPREIQVSGGKIARLVDGKEGYVMNEERFVLNVEDLQWRRERRLRSV